MTTRIPYTEAVADLNRRIVARYGDHPDVIDCLTIRVVPCAHCDSERSGFVIYAFPPDACGNPDRLLARLVWSYYGDVPLCAEGVGKS